MDNRKNLHDYDVLRSRLEAYIPMREGERAKSGKEHKYNFFGLKGYRCTDKINAVKKMIRDIDGESDVKYSELDLDALRDKRVGRILASVNQLPFRFVQAEKHRLRQLLREYVQMKTSEIKFSGQYIHYLFGIGLGDKGDLKVSAANKVLSALENKSVRYDESRDHNELDALRSGRLGEIMRANQYAQPENFKAAVKSSDARIEHLAIFE